MSEYVVRLHQSISELYPEVLRELREYERHEDSGKAVCVNCRRKKEDHVFDGRCSIDSLSRSFANSDANNWHRLKQVRDLLEQLLELAK